MSAANMSPVPEKKRGSSGVSIRKRRGLKSEVAVEPMMVMFLMSSSCDPRGGDVGESALASAGCMVSAPDSVGVCRPEAVVEVVFEGVREGTRDGTVRLSRVNRSEVIITCGTW